MLIGWNSETCIWGSFLKPLFSQLLEYIEYICEEQVKRTKGFVLQIQQGVSHEKSHMQVAEERQSAWLNVPRIAVFAFDDNRVVVGGSNKAKQCMETALAQAEAQWRNGIEAELQMCVQRYEPVDGADKVPTDSIGRVHGRAKCTYPEGHVYIGEYQHGLKHGHGTYTWPNGRVYVGEYQHNKMHGKGKVTNATGDFELGFWVAGERSGEFVKFSKDRQKAWLLKDGKVVRELSRSEAAKKVEELGQMLSNWLISIWIGERFHFLMWHPSSKCLASVFQFLHGPASGPNNHQNHLTHQCLKKCVITFRKLQINIHQPFSGGKCP